MRKLSCVILACVTLSLACSLSGNATPPVETKDPEEPRLTRTGNTPVSPVSPTPERPLGTLRLETDQVLHGPEEAALVPLLESAPFFVKDRIRVVEGGEALLDFGDQMELRLFNDTEVGMVSADIAEGVPLGVQVYLFFGGFTGEVVAEGGSTVIQTPGGAEITVLGTEYFVTYDPEAGLTTVGNFEGSVEVAAGGEERSLNDGTYRVVPDGAAPGPELPLPMTREEFEKGARQGGSPVQAAAQANTWSLQIRHAFVHDYADHWEWVEDDPTFLREWNGSFSITGDRLVGSGTGRIVDENLKCNNFSDPFNVMEIEFHIEGSFEFEILGEVTTGEDGKPVFIFDLPARDLVTNDLTSVYEIDGNCDFLSEFFLDNNRSIIEDLPLLDAERIEISASSGAEEVYALDPSPYTKYIVGEDPWTYKDIYFLYPIEVRVTAGE